MDCKPIAYIHTDFPTKFGIPRQSGILDMLTARIVMEPEYRDPNAFRGISSFSHLWLIWEFSESEQDKWSPTVRPPRMGGNARMGVFATRSPFRPNPIGLSCVRLLAVDGSDLLVSGADLMDGTPILDIKPYLPFADCKPEASGGFAEPLAENHLQVSIDQKLLEQLPSPQREALPLLLEEDPRPHYQDDPDRIYGFRFAGYEIRFRVEGNHLTVTDIQKA